MPAPPLVGGGGCGWQTWQRTRYFDNTTVAPSPSLLSLLTAPTACTACVSVRYIRAALCTCLSSCLATPQNFRSENQFIMRRSSSGSIYSTLLTAYMCVCVCARALGGMSLGQKLIKAKMNPRFKMSVSMPLSQSLYTLAVCMCVCVGVYWCVCVCKV